MALAVGLLSGWPGSGADAAPWVVSEPDAASGGDGDVRMGPDGDASPPDVPPAEAKLVVDDPVDLAALGSHRALDTDVEQLRRLAVANN